MTKTWSVRGARIKIRILPDELEKTAGGIITTLGTDNKDDMEIGEVVELGNNAYLAEDVAWVKIGDVVMFQRYAGKPVKEGKELYRFLKDIDVIAVRHIIEETENVS
jgi:chaperonin GroES